MRRYPCLVGPEMGGFRLELGHRPHFRRVEVLPEVLPGPSAVRKQASVALRPPAIRAPDLEISLVAEYVVDTPAEKTVKIAPNPPRTENLAEPPPEHGQPRETVRGVAATVRGDGVGPQRVRLDQRPVKPCRVVGDADGLEIDRRVAPRHPVERVDALRDELAAVSGGVPLEGDEFGYQTRS